MNHAEFYLIVAGSVATGAFAGLFMAILRAWARSIREDSTDEPTRDGEPRDVPETTDGVPQMYEVCLPLHVGSGSPAEQLAALQEALAVNAIQRGKAQEAHRG